MQKKIIALAVAGLVSGAAFAQSNVTIYGTMDVGYTNMGDSTVANRGSRNGIDASSWSSSKIGFKGSEDLGNGLSALFQIETGLTPDANAGSAWNNRDTYIGLSSTSWGTVIAGHISTPQDTLIGKVDPMGGSNMAKMEKGLYSTTISTNGGAAVTRLQNTVAYVSPSFSGFNVVGAYSNGALANENSDNIDDLRVWAINPNYSNGPIFVGFNYHDADRKDPSVANGELQSDMWDIGGTYDFGVVKLHAMYGQDDMNTSLGITDTDYENDKWFIGVSAPLGNGKLMFVYGNNDAERDIVGAGDLDGDIKKWSIGYTYNLSKRTFLYGAYTDYSDDSDTRAIDAAAPATFNGVGTGISGTYRNGYQFGMVHNF